MAKKLVFALLCAAVALASARDLLAPLPAMAMTSLPDKLQELNKRMAAAQEPGSVAVASVLDADYYGKDEYEPKYEPKYEQKGEYEPKYEHKGEYEPKYHSEYEKKDYGYGKVSVKLYEKFRSSLRHQHKNEHTFQFTSELTCQNPKKIETEHEDGIIGFPLVTDRMKLVTVGVCEWTVTMVKEQRISEHAKLKGNTNVVCTFTEEAERHCKHAGEVLEEGLTVSGQGLVYNFDNTQYGSYKGKASAAADKKDAEEPADGLDVYLTLINGVVGRNKELKYDNGALQYFFGVPPSLGDAKDTAAAQGYSGQSGDPSGEYTLVFKH